MKKYLSHAWLSDGDERIAVRAEVLNILDRVDAEGARAAAGKGAQNQAAGDTCTPRSTPVHHFHSGDSVVTTNIALKEHRDVGWGEDDPIGLHQRHLMILDMLMEVTWPRLGHGLWGRCLISELN